MIDFLISLTKLDWKPYALAVVGFHMAVFADRLGEHYGVWLTGVLVLLGWWAILLGLWLAKRDDLPIWKIF